MPLKNKTLISATFSTEELDALNKASEKTGKPKTKLIREAVAAYLPKLRRKEGKQ